MLIERRAFAKINLDLRITAARADGFHDLATIFQTISVTDLLRFETGHPDEPFGLRCTDPEVPADQDNLVWRAATSLWRALARQGPPRGVRIELEKDIPTQAGLGGGSADAAVALGALAHIWKASLSEQDWWRLAASLGADVPYFLIGGTARAVARGDEIEPWPDLPSVEVVLAFPEFGVSTAEAYAWYDASGVAPSSPEPGLGAGPTWRSWIGACRNDLEPPVFARHKVLELLKGRLRDAGAVHALMSGSGSAVFGLFESGSQADAAAGQLRADGVAARRARTVPSAEYRREAFGPGTGPSGLPPA